MRILVTGAAGFIGFHLTRRLLEQGHEVVGFDNFNAYYSVQLKRDRHAQLEKLDGYTGIEADLCDYTTLRECIQDPGVDRVCHLAAQAGVRHSLTHPFDYQKSNLEGFLNMLEACRHSRTSRLVYASSSSVYGGNTSLPFSEKDNVDTPVSLYAATKKANELMARSYTHLYGMQTVGLRFFTVYGPWGRPDMAMWLFAEAMLEGRPIKVFNHGRCRRDFTYVDDIVAGVTAALFADGLEPCEIINLGNHRSEELMDMIACLAKALGVEPEMDMLPAQPGDVAATYADIERAQRKLGFEPKTPLSEGIPKFVEWFLHYRKTPKA